MSDKTIADRDSSNGAHLEPGGDHVPRLREIDARLQALIGERARMVAESRSGQVGEGPLPFFAYEELRELVERHDGSLPVTVVEHVWRELAAAMALAGTQTAIHCEASLDPAALIDTIRYHFGFSISVEEAGDAPDVMRAVAENPGDFGIVQLQERADLPWWRSLGGLERFPRKRDRLRDQNSLQDQCLEHIPVAKSGSDLAGYARAPVIVARLPFLVAEDRPADLPALIVADATRASRGDMAAYDTRWRGQLPGPLMSSGIEVLAFHRTAEGVDALLGAPVEMSEIEIAEMCREAGAEPEVLRHVGFYAAPIDIDDMSGGDFDG